MKSRLRSSMLFAGLWLATGCGLLVGVKDLEVEPQAVIEEDSGNKPDVDKDPGPPIKNDVQRPEVVTVQTDADAGCVLKSLGPLLPTTHAVSGVGSDWQQINDAKRLDDNDAAAFTLGARESKELRLHGFDFRLPVNATIRGIKVDLRGRSTNPNIYRDLSVRLALANVGASGTEHAKPENYPTGFEAREYGGMADLWGLQLTTEDVNHLDFGVALRLQRPDALDWGTTAGGYDVVRMTVYFCE